MAIDITKLPGDMLIGVDNLNKKFKQFAKDFKDQNESIRIQETRDRAMNTDSVKENFLIKQSVKHTIQLSL